MTLLDHRGRPIDMGALKREVLAEELSRSGGARLFGGEHPSIGLEPGKLGRILREAEDGDPVSYFALAEEMEEKDLHYLSVLGTRKRQVAQLDITVEAASNAKEDEADAELIRSVIDTFDDDTLCDMLDAVGKGVSVTEIIWDTSANQWMPKRFEWVDPRMLDFDRATRKEPMLKTVSGMEPLAPYKFVQLELKAKSGLPVRGGLARPVSWFWMFKNYGLKDWNRFIEAYGQPMRVGKFHAGATEAEKRSLLRSVAALGSDAAAVIPQAMQIEFIEAKSQGSASGLYENHAKYLDQLVSKGVLGQTATTDAISGGHAVSKEHNQVREDIERSDAKALARALGRFVVQPVIDLNHGPRRKYPTIVIGRPDEQDAALMIDAVEKLTKFGFRASQSQLRAAVGLKDPDPEDELFVVPGDASAPPGPTKARLVGARR